MQVETRMQSLSHGQRSCILFAKITYRCPDMLIMDEPTNFLDMESVDALIGATLKFKGALLLVSHNRGFLNGCVNTYLSITPGRFEVFDNLKACERATYQFIEEMEGGGGLKAGANCMTNTVTKVKAAAAQPISIAISVSKPVAPPKPVEEKKEEKVVEDKPKVVKPQVVCDESLIGQECLAVYKADGREYPAIIKRVFPNSGEVTVEYVGYNENAILKLSNIRIGAKAAPPKPKQNAKPAGKQGGNKQQQQNGNKGGQQGGNKARAGGQQRSGGR
jgi:energy-coupling factor transporter ATP-binding protein EcfA2